MWRWTWRQNARCARTGTSWQDTAALAQIEGTTIDINKLWFINNGPFSICKRWKSRWEGKFLRTHSPGWLLTGHSAAHFPSCTFLPCRLKMSWQSARRPRSSSPDKLPSCGCNTNITRISFGENWTCSWSYCYYTNHIHHCRTRISNSTARGTIWMWRSSRNPGSKQCNRSSSFPCIRWSNLGLVVRANECWSRIAVPESWLLYFYQINYIIKLWGLLLKIVAA